MGRAVLLRIHNASLAPVVLAWVPERDDEVAYATLQPNQVHTQQTFVGHRWRLKTLPGHNERSGELDAPQVDSTVIFTDEDGVSLISHTLIPVHALLDGCTVRARVCGVITVTAVNAVRDEAVAACVECLSSIIDDMPEKAAVLRAMGALGVELAIIGVGQTTTDVPAHAHLKGMDVQVGPTRTFDDGTRGLGATVACPVMSVAEENLLPGVLVDRRYPDESILVHEFAHTVRLRCAALALPPLLPPLLPLCHLTHALPLTLVRCQVMNLGLKDTHWYADIKHAYGAARRSNAYDLKSYCMENADGTSAPIKAPRARMHPIAHV